MFTRLAAHSREEKSTFALFPQYKIQLSSANFTVASPLSLSLSLSLTYYSSTGYSSQVTLSLLHNTLYSLLFILTSYFPLCPQSLLVDKRKNLADVVLCCKLCCEGSKFKCLVAAVWQGSMIETQHGAGFSCDST